MRHSTFSCQFSWKKCKVYIFQRHMIHCNILLFTYTCGWDSCKANPWLRSTLDLSMLAWYLVNVHLFLVTPLKAIGTSLGLFFQVEKVFSRLGVKGRAVSRLDGKVRAMFRLRWMMWAMFQLRLTMYVEWWNASCHTSTCIWHMYWRNFNSSWISISDPTEQYTWYIFDIS